MRTLKEIEPRQPISVLPYVITNPGAYFIPFDLTGVSGSNGITIAASNVKLDLRGFTISGVPGSLSGIHVAAKESNLNIMNGTIAHWGGCGVSATNADDCILAGVTVFTNGLAGVATGDNVMMQDCVAYANGYGDTNNADGIVVRNFCSLATCKSIGNSGHGIAAGFACNLERCTAFANAFDGIRLSDYCTIRDCLASGNVGNGIRMDSNCRVLDNTCVGNGTTNYIGTAGIWAQGNGNRIDNNSCDGNIYGIFTYGAKNLAVRNSASYNWWYNFSWNGNNYYGQFLGHDEITMGSTNLGFIASNPWANFNWYQ